MSIAWWYLLQNYFKVLILAVLSFIAILLVSRLEEIAQFAALGAKSSYLLLFTLYQIPYVLPIAIPISCLLSSMLLFQRLSHTHELTALRACGFSLIKIIVPILCAAAFLSIGTFYIVSEVATSSHLATRRLVHELSSVNPLILLQSSKIAHLQQAFVQMEPIRNGEAAQDLVIVINNSVGSQTKRLHLCLAKQVEMKGEKLLATQVSFISSSPSSSPAEHDHLIIENEKWVSSSAKQFAALLGKTAWKIANDHLKLSLLRIRYDELRSQRLHNKKIERNYNKCCSEFLRRLSIGCATTTFTLMGALFGMEIGRNRSKKRVVLALLLTGFALIAFCLGKTMGHLLWLAALCFFLPHALMLLSSLWALNRINKGIE